jgi:hypothetical protein
MLISIFFLNSVASLVHAVPMLSSSRHWFYYIYGFFYSHCFTLLKYIYLLSVKRYLLRSLILLCI